MRSAWALASLGVLEDAGWEWVHDRAAELAAGLAVAARRARARGRPARALDARVLEGGRMPRPRWRGWPRPGFVVRSIPSHGLVRASVGAWSSEEELAELAGLAAV